MVVIQNNKKEMIGLVRLHVGLYICDIPINKSNVHLNHSSHCIVKNISLWHFHLGRPFHEELHYFENYICIFFTNSSHICDICHMAKHRKFVGFIAYAKNQFNIKVKTIRTDNKA